MIRYKQNKVLDPGVTLPRNSKTFMDKEMTRREQRRNYSDKVHIDKMKEVIPDELQNTLVIYEITNRSPKTWDDYLKLLMQAYKALHPDKA